MKRICMFAAFLATVLSSLPANALMVNLNPVSYAHCISSISLCYGGQPVRPVAAPLIGTSNGIRHFMVFDLSEVEGLITSAYLEIEAEHGTYISFKDQENYLIRQLDGDQSRLFRTLGGSAAKELYSDIAGDVLGIAQVATPGFTRRVMPAVTVDLNGELALSYLNAAVGNSVAFGGTTGATFQFFWPDADLALGKGNSDITLALAISPSPVPLPATGFLMFVGVASFTLLARKRRSARPRA